MCIAICNENPILLVDCDAVRVEYKLGTITIDAPTIGSMDKHWRIGAAA
jgi:hypothetical protein